EWRNISYSPGTSGSELALSAHWRARARFKQTRLIMNDLMPPLPLFSAFVIASVVLAITPGPAVLYIVTRSVSQGRLSGVASVAGVALGNIGNALGASLGLAALFALSSVAFTVVKYLVSLYLVDLGVLVRRAI